MANSVTARFNDNCKVHVAMSDDTTVTKAVIIDADGNETDIGGGGGSSDFSIAEVTLINNGAPGGYTINLPVLTDENGIDFATSLLVQTELIVNVPLYKGKLKVPFLLGNVTEDEPAFTDGVSVDDNFDYLLITSDGSFTATAAPNV